MPTPTPVMKVNGCEGELVLVGHQAGREVAARCACAMAPVD